MVRVHVLKKVRHAEARLLREPRFALFVVGLVSALLLTSCGSPSRAPKAALPPPTGMVATLEDEVRDLPNGRIAWSTYWKLCWEKYPGAKAYELQTVTSEGTSPKLRRLSEPSFRIEVAAGENEKSEGFVNREIQLALQSGQLAYRVRAVLDDNRFSEWSPLMTVGAVARNRRQRAVNHPGGRGIYRADPVQQVIRHYRV